MSAWVRRWQAQAATVCAAICTIMASMCVGLTLAAVHLHQTAVLEHRRALRVELDAKVSRVRAALIELNHYRRIEGLPPVMLANEWEVSLDP